MLYIIFVIYNYNVCITIINGIKYVIVIHIKKTSIINTVNYISNGLTQREHEHERKDARETTKKNAVVNFVGHIRLCRCLRNSGMLCPDI